jgi:hypothetical protein
MQCYDKKREIKADGNIWIPMSTTCDANKSACAGKARAGKSRCTTDKDDRDNGCCTSITYYTKWKWLYNMPSYRLSNFSMIYITMSLIDE